MVSVSISRSRMWLRLSVPHTTVSTPKVCSSSRFLGLEARATVRFTPNSRFAIWQATRLFSSAPVTATKASQLATSAVRMVSKLMASPQITGISSESASERHSISCGSMMVTLWRWASRLWARYMPTLPPPAIQTFICFPHFLLCQCAEHRLLGEHRGADGVDLVSLVVQHLQVRVGHAADHLLTAEDAFCDLCRHQVY